MTEPKISWIGGVRHEARADARGAEIWVPVQEENTMEEYDAFEPDETNWRE